MNKQTSLIITSISAPSKILKFIAEECKKNKTIFILIGDKASPDDFYINNCNYYSLKKQLNSEFNFARACLLNHYSRKNIGYLFAMKNKSKIIIETDDDNIPYNNFWFKKTKYINSKYLENKNWINIYKYFSKDIIWPRGFPLNKINDNIPEFHSLPKNKLLAPIQQGLANDNPDIDAIYRLILQLPIKFTGNETIAIGKNTLCPFNSQNTVWFKEVFPLLYLPSYCSFRMTDIWRSFIAQRIMWENNWFVLFTNPTVYQERNEHNLMKDFKDEMSGYLNNERICEELKKLTLKKGIENLNKNMFLCYEKLISMNLIDKRELSLLEIWFSDIKKLA